MAADETLRRQGAAELPGSVHNLLRSGRTALLWLAGPFDFLVQRLTGRGDLPPLWLRRHTGSISKYESSAGEMEESICELGLVRPDDHVLDVGCGSGAMAVRFARILGPNGRYVGLDVHRPSLRWCERRFSGDPRFQFRRVPVSSPYGSGSQGPVESYLFPMSDGEAGLILSKSLFTHLLESEARHYLCEIRRTLCPGRAAVVTAFLFEPESRTGRGESPMFRFGDQRGFIRWRFKEKPEAAVAYERSYFLRMIEEAGLRLQWLVPGFLPGDTPRPSGQDLLILGH